MDISATVDAIDHQLHADGCPDGERMTAVAAIASALYRAAKAIRLSPDNIARELERNGYDVRKAAVACGCHHSTVYRKLSH
ncbi:MAG: hypothetical protein KGL35_00900 [Bradyrhizobium sp.]|nr:hypothetical protein [Bradyrhizobium sp.]